MKMKMKKRAGRRPPLVLLLLVLSLGFASTGAAYGLWSETLVSNAVVETGSVNAEWTGASCAEFYDWPWPPEGYGEVGGKDVGSTTWTVDGGDPQILNITINNGYPSYAVDCQVELMSTGTVPVIVEEIEFVPGVGLTNCTVRQSQSTGTFTASCDQLTVKYVDGLGTQLHQGDELASSLRVHVEQEAGENSQYTFSVRVLLVQYNESQFP